MKSDELLKLLHTVENDLYEVSNGIVKVEQSEKVIEAIKYNLYSLSKDVFEASKLENVYCDFCSFSVYKKTYKKRLKVCLKEDEGIIFGEKDFAKREINNLDSLYKSEILQLYHPDLKKPFSKKLFFLQNKISELSRYPSGKIIDLSDTNAIQKMIYLHELGVIDFLVEKSLLKGKSVNTLASFISAFTGIKAGTVQSYLNPMLSKSTVDQDKNPILNKNAVEKVKKALSKL